MSSSPPTPTRSPLKIVIVHDWLYGGGAEKVVEQLHIMYPDAPIYTSYCSDEWRARLDNKVVTGYLQRWPFSRMRRFLPLLRVWWFRSLKLDQYDIIISSSGNGEAKHVRKTRDTQKHVNYCHTPPHFLWQHYDTYLASPGFGMFNPLVRVGLRALLGPLRRMDRKAAQHVDQFIANSSSIKQAIHTYYDKEAMVVYPPVAIERFSQHTPATERQNFIIFGRHVQHKRFDLAIRACNELGVPLDVIGTGPETPRLKNMAGPTITFHGRVSDEKLEHLLQHAQAFLFTSDEDFGITAVEAQAAGLPVIAYRAGGALDNVIEGETGEYFDEQTVESLVDAMKTFNYKLYNYHAITANARRFTEDVFREKIKDVII